MPYVIPCPHCAARLKSPQAVPAGRQITCPQCKTTFTTTQPAALLGDDKPAPAATGGPPKPPLPKKPASKPDIMDEPEVLEAYVEDEDDRPKPKKRRDDDEDDDRPKSKRRHDDDEDDDRPKSKRRRDEDEDDNRPKAKSRRNRDDDEDDDRPPAKRRRDENEDDDDRPRKRSKGKKGNKKLVLILGLVGGGVFMLLMAVLLLVVDPFGLFGSGGGGAPSDMLAVVPTNTTRLEYMDLGEMRNVGERFGKPRPEMPNRFGGGNEVVAMLTATPAGGGFRGFGETTTIYRMRSTIDVPTTVGQVGGQQRTYANKTYYSSGLGEFYYFPGGRVVVTTTSESVMQQILTRDANPGAKLNSALMEVQGRCRGAVWNASTGSEVERPAGTIDGVSAKLLAQSNSFSISGSRVIVRDEKLYDSSDFAGKMVAKLRADYDLKRAELDAKGIKVKFSREGSGVVITRDAPLETGNKTGPDFGFGFGD